ncbi:hypothetical protein KO317_02500 [Candidatus Micrarchaeota archaeon]|nr:hypothetical protein [Candidatus Micrarchaeota archaeon]
MIDVFHLNSYTCQKVVRRLSDTRFNFIPVRTEDIPKIPEDSILLWGDGTQHHFSAKRDPKPELITNADKNWLKVNIDQHSDTLLNVYDDEQIPRCWNHIAFSALIGLQIGLIMPEKFKCKKKQMIFLNEMSNRDCWLPNVSYFDISKLKSFEGKIQATIDLDILNFYPVYTDIEINETWVLLEEGFNFDELLTICEILNSKNATRLDIGGLWIPDEYELEQIKEFEISEKVYPSNRISNVYTKDNIKKALNFLKEVLCVLTQ